MDIDLEEICKARIVIGGGAGTVILTPVILASLGFTSAGIAAGSIAAQLMLYFAILNGGGVAAGGLVAMLQSIGAGGLSWFGSMFLGGYGALMGSMLSSICNITVKIDES